MKFNTIVLSLLLVSVVTIADDKNVTTLVETLSSAVETVVAPVAHKCECGPTEHWFFKACVQNYIAQFPLAGLIANNDTEGLSENLVQAINMLAKNIAYVDQDGKAITPELNLKGGLFLPMIKSLDFRLCKEILRNVDVATTLTAQELYQQWSDQLKTMKFAK